MCYDITRLLQGDFCMRKNIKYSFEIKLEAIRMKDKEYSQREILTALGIKSPT